MSAKSNHDLTRRSFLWRMLIVPPAFVLAACSGRTLEQVLAGIAQPAPTATASDSDMSSGVAVAQVLPPTPACGDDDDDDLTPAQTEGPFYTPNTPQRVSFLEEGITGTRLVVTGYVLSTTCAPIAGALLDFWHCDDAGVYDNVGYRLRGHQFSDDAGRFVLETIVPGVYPGRTRHIHVKVQAPFQPVLTTQLYFSNEPGNATDGIYRPELEMIVQDTADGKIGTFNFVLDI